MDIWTKAKRSEVMSLILGKDTKPELLVRKMLTTMGYRYRLNVKNLPGKPDIVLRKYKTVIFVHGCFWHLHSNCRDGTIPKTRVEYWQQKLLNNKVRDGRNIRALRRDGWKVLRLWECEVERKPEKVRSRIYELLNKSKVVIKNGELAE
jgi:DNA mismatch endonuclease (patch repair protein)